MRVFVGVLSCLMLAVLIAVVALCGVVDLAGLPAEAGVFLESAPVFAEPPPVPTAADPERLSTDLACERCSFDERRVAALGIPYTNDGVMNASDGRLPERGVRGPGVHSASRRGADTLGRIQADTEVWRGSV